MESAYSDEFELTLDDFQEWYDKLNPKTDNSRVSSFIWLSVAHCTFLRYEKLNKYD